MTEITTTPFFVYHGVTVKPYVDTTPSPTIKMISQVGDL